MKISRSFILATVAVLLLQSCCLPYHGRGGGRGHHHWSGATETQTPPQTVAALTARVGV